LQNVEFAGALATFRLSSDNHQPKDVTIIMDNTGIGDGNPEGLSFTLQGNTTFKIVLTIQK
jgi:hypothetical protein